MGSNFFFILAKLLCGREVKEMAVVYATLIIKGKKTIDDVPTMLREQVKQMLVDLDVQA